MAKFIITYYSYRTHWDREVYTEAEKEIAERRYNSLIKCGNTDKVNIERKED
jgi:hypothetical protein